MIREGDVYLTKDGWGTIVGKSSLSSDGGIYTKIFLNRHIITPSGDSTTKFNWMIDKEDKFLFNICDLFNDAKEALKEPDENTNP